MTRICVALASVLALSSSSVASAQALAGEKASAEALFDQGVSLVASGKFLDGCAKFEASQAIEPTLGTELHLADCYERAGKTASAWALFKESAALAQRQNDHSRESVARIRADALSHRLSYLLIDTVSDKPPGFAVERNGRSLPLASLGAPIPVDPGPQDVVASAPAHRAWSTHLVVPNRAGTVNVSIPRLSPLASRLGPSAPANVASDPGRTQRAIGIAATTVGAAGLVTGFGLGLYAKRENDRSRLERYCPSSGCTSEGVDLRQRAQLLASISTVTLAASGAVLAAGVLIWSTTPSKREPRASADLRWTAQAGPDSFQTALSGQF
jgi:serine/threonine-protein kinase